MDPKDYAITELAELAISVLMLDLGYEIENEVVPTYGIDPMRHQNLYEAAEGIIGRQAAIAFAKRISPEKTDLRRLRVHMHVLKSQIPDFEKVVSQIGGYFQNKSSEDVYSQFARVIYHGSGDQVLKMIEFKNSKYPKPAEPTPTA